MATGLVLSVAQTLLAALQCKELRDVCSIFGYELQLDELQCTVTTIKAVLLDAESKHQELTHEGRDWVESLKDAVYDVDDLLDEFRTMALQRHQMIHAKVSKKVRRFFSRSNKFLVAFNTSHDIKKIRNKLDNIAKNRSDFGFGDTYEPVKRIADSCSFVREDSIIGRQKDKEAIVGMLLHENKEANLSFVSIIGIGGLGKTALAQLVFNDTDVMRAFDLRMWVCVSEDFSMEGIFSKMLENDGLKLEGLQREVRQKIEGKKYLLVLDDVWNENRNEWFTLRDFLNSGGKGSRVLVTSRSKQVARIIENNSMHLIQGLSDQDSWSLFQRMAFECGKEPKDSELVVIGKEVVKKCANVPLSIRVVGSLLYGQGRSKWLSFNRVNLSKMGGDKEGILPILKFSYYHLTPSLKSCFSYCALFPKDYVIVKEFLINIWVAQGCLDSGLDDGRSLEDVGEEYFSILLQRCFLQDTEKNVYDEISSCKMHDLIHDLAQEVAGKEFSVVNTKVPVSNNIRHVSIAAKSFALFAQSDSLDKMKDLRMIYLTTPISLSQPDFESDVAKMFAQCRRLRVLNLYHLDMRFTPNTFNKLVHLRYLDLSFNHKLEILPKSITKLHNLQVLNLQNCSKLKEWPDDLGKLFNLRQLDLTYCGLLMHMPPGFDNLTCLHTLTEFILGSGSSNQVQIGQLQDLRQLTNLKGSLNIVVKKDFSYDGTKAMKERCLLNKLHIRALRISGGRGYWVPEINIDEGLLEVLEPHHNMRGIEIKGYGGIKLPHWATTLESSLPRLVRLTLEGFPRLKHLPSLSQLQHLKFLKLHHMTSVEYIENDRVLGTANFTFFQSLEVLIMRRLPMLKGWWRDGIPCSIDNLSGQAIIPSFPCLHKLEIVGCPSMTTFPQCPHLRKAELMNFNEGLKFCTVTKQAEASGSQQHIIRAGLSNIISSISCIDIIEKDDSSNSNNSHLSKIVDLEELTTDNVRSMKSIFGESIRVRRYLCIKTSRTERLSDAGLEHLMNNLQHFRIVGCWELELGEEGDGMMMPWKALHNLTHLEIDGSHTMVNLPKGLQFLTSLQSLSLHRCSSLERLPEWLDSLTSLQ